MGESTGTGCEEESSRKGPLGPLRGAHCGGSRACRSPQPDPRTADPHTADRPARAAALRLSCISRRSHGGIRTVDECNLHTMKNTENRETYKIKMTRPRMHQAPWVRQTPCVPGPGCTPQACVKRRTAFRDPVLQGRQQHLRSGWRGED